jgi:hypothetical protein
VIVIVIVIIVMTVTSRHYSVFLNLALD